MTVIKYTDLHLNCLKMIRIFAILTMLCFIQAISFAQISVSNLQFPQAGQLLFTATDTSVGEVGVSPPSSQAQNWDYSLFLPWRADTTIVLNASSGASFADFPEADILLPGNGGESYFDNEGDSLELLGFFGDPGFGVSFLVVPFSPSVIWKTPMTHGDVFHDEFSFTQAIDPNDFPELSVFLPPFPPIDSIRALYVSNREDTIDAWGNLSTHLGNFDVIRRKSVDYSDLFIEFKVFGFWVDPGSLGIDIPFGGLDTTTTYEYRDASSTEAILIMNMNNDGSVNNMVYKTDPAVVTSVEIPIEEAGIISIYPNPARDYFNLSWEGMEAGNYRIQLVDQVGKVLLRKVLFLQESGLLPFSTDGFPSGMFFVEIQPESGNVLPLQKVIHIY